MEVSRFSKRNIIILFLLLVGGILLFIFLRYQTNLRQRASALPNQEVEAGILTGAAKEGIDAAASGGKYIEFGTNTITPAPLPTTRPVFGSYVETGKYATYHQLQGLVLNYAKVIYTEGMNWCGPGDWSDPQVIIDAPAGRYDISPTFLAKIDSILRSPVIVNNGIIGRGFVMNTKEGGHPKPDSLPTDVSNPLFEQAMKRVENDCTRSIVSYYKDRISNWRIANEIFEDNGNRRISWHTNKPVDIKHKLTTAIEANPNAQLFIDDYSNTEINSKSTGMLNYMKELKQQGYPIHGIGFQGHNSLRFPPNYQSIRDNIQRFKDAGFDVAFTEVDVAIDGASGTEEEKRAKQKEIFKNLAQICKDFSNCKYFILYGFDDNLSWLGTDAKAHPFDTSFVEKPAFQGLKEVFGL